MRYKAEIKKLIKEEEKRQQHTISLIPSENLASKDVREALGSGLTNKYSEGYPGRRYYGGNEIIDEIETLTQNLARKVFKLKAGWYVNVQAYSGSPANIAVYHALLKPKDKIMGMSLPFGGHLTHGWKVNFSGQTYKSVQYGVGDDGLINYKDVLKLARKEKPKIIVAGATAYSREIDFKKFSEIAKKVGAYLFVDMAHIAGLVAGGVHASPFKYADVVTTTTHKTLRGPRGAIIFVNKDSKIAKKNKIDIAERIDKAVFPSLQGGPHNNQTAAIAVCLSEALEAGFKKYTHQIVKNAKVLASELKKQDFKIVSGGTDNHLMLVDLTNIEITGGEAEDMLGEVGIIVNRNTIPNDPRTPFNPSGIRLGTPLVTTRGMKEKEMKKLAKIIGDVILRRERKEDTKKEVKKIAARFIYER